MQIFGGKKKSFFVWFCLVQSSVTIVKKAKENGNFVIIKNITISSFLI